MRKIASVASFALLTTLGLPLISSQQGSSQAQVPLGPAKACLATNLKSTITKSSLTSGSAQPGGNWEAHIDWDTTYDCTDATVTQCSICVKWELWRRTLDDDGNPIWQLVQDSPAVEPDDLDECNSQGNTYPAHGDTITNSLLFGHTYKWVFLAAPYDPTKPDCDHQDNWVVVGSKTVTFTFP